MLEHCESYSIAAWRDGATVRAGTAHQPAGSVKPKSIGGSSPWKVAAEMACGIHFALACAIAPCGTIEARIIEVQAPPPLVQVAGQESSDDLIPTGYLEALSAKVANARVLPEPEVADFDDPY